MISKKRTLPGGRYAYRLLGLITLVYFVLPFIHISFALIGLLCMALPFLLLQKTGKKTWCHSACPRSYYFDFFTKRKYPRSLPAFLKKKEMAALVFSYFCMNTVFIALSTSMVSQGQIEPIGAVRFLMILTLPFKLPQLLHFEIPPWLLHLSYRVLSVMFTSAVMGTVLAVLYRPRVWCRVCPVSSLSDRVLETRKQSHPPEV